MNHDLRQPVGGLKDDRDDEGLDEGLDDDSDDNDGVTNPYADVSLNSGD